MTHVAFLVADTAVVEDGNCLRLANALLARSDVPFICHMDTLALRDSEIVVDGYKVTTLLLDGEPGNEPEPLRLRDFDVTWVLSLGMRASFLDKYQLLFSLSRESRVINSVDAIMHLKSKYFLASQSDLLHYPETHAGTNPAALIDIMARGGQWIVKPPAGSLGRGVFKLTADDPNAWPLLESLCGPDNENYVLLQRRVPEIEQGEKRVLFADGQVIGQYRRRPSRDHRTNLMQGGIAEACDLTSEEATYCERLGAFLKAQGASFVGLDMAYPWVIEFNVINPGGIATIHDLTGEDLAPVAIEHIIPH